MSTGTIVRVRVCQGERVLKNMMCSTACEDDYTYTHAHLDTHTHAHIHIHGHTLTLTNTNRRK